MPEKETRNYEITGTPQQLDIVERILGRMTYLGQVGSSRTFTVFVDGDGAARVVATKNGELLNHDDLLTGGDARFLTDKNGNVRADLG